MHQVVDEEEEDKVQTEQERLLGRKYQITQNYRGAIKWAGSVLDYKRRFEREEDYGEDDLQEHINFLKKDSRRELKSVAIDIKMMRKKISDIDKRLMDLNKKGD